jgi:hypothetical protein
MSVTMYVFDNIENWSETFSSGNNENDETLRTILTSAPYSEGHLDWCCSYQHMAEWYLNQAATTSLHFVQFIIQCSFVVYKLRCRTISNSCFTVPAAFSSRFLVLFTHTCSYLVWAEAKSNVSSVRGNFRWVWCDSCEQVWWCRLPLTHY